MGSVMRLQFAGMPLLSEAIGSMEQVDEIIGPHPLDGRDEHDCYQTMMAERSTLDSARRESEDTIVKTIIQLSTALIALMSGFIFQYSTSIENNIAYLICAAIFLFVIAMCFALAEHFFSALAHAQQIILLENYYTKVSKKFSEAPANRWVRRTRFVSLASFISAIICLSFTTAFQTMSKIDVEQAISTAKDQHTKPGA